MHSLLEYESDLNKRLLFTYSTLNDSDSKAHFLKILSPGSSHKHAENSAVHRGSQCLGQHAHAHGPCWQGCQQQLLKGEHLFG